MTDPESPLALVLAAFRAVEAGQRVDFAAVRARLVAEADQIAAVARDVPAVRASSGQLAAFAHRLVAVVDRLEGGDVAGAGEDLGAAMRESFERPPGGQAPAA